MYQVSWNSHIEVDLQVKKKTVWNSGSFRWTKLHVCPIIYFISIIESNMNMFHFYIPCTNNLCLLECEIDSIDIVIWYLCGSNKRVLYLLSQQTIHLHKNTCFYSSSSSSYSFHSTGKQYVISVEANISKFLSK